MSVVEPLEKHPWVVISAVLAAVVLVSGAVVWQALPGKRMLSSGGNPGDVRSDELVPQASWKLSVHAAGVTGRLTKVQQQKVEAQSPALKSLVRRVYDSMFIHPSHLSQTLKQHFTPAAARALRRSGAGANNAAAVATTLREASIGVEADGAGGADYAVVEVALKATSTAATATPFLHRSTLWLRGENKQWRVIGFSVDQAPAPEPKEKSKGQGEHK